MLTRPEEAEAEANSDEAKANSHEAEVKIALIFPVKFYTLTPFSPKSEMFGPFSTGLQKCGLKTVFNMITLLVNIPKMTSYAFGRRLNRKCP